MYPARTRKYRRPRRGTESRPVSFASSSWLGWDRQFLDLLLIFRIHGLGAPTHCRFGKAVLARVVVEPRIGAGEMMRDPADWMIDLAARHTILRRWRVARV